ncbi:MAG: 2TM domain-containing protein [Ramlibacter sp.]|nr:2TM domain-containing protein [Ramlibacter sp.]
MRPLPSEELERLAHKRAGAKLGWYVHAALYLVVNLFVFAISHYGFGERSWPMLPLLGWGLGLGLHGISVFMLGAGGQFRERLLQQERDRLRRQRNGS